MHQVHRLQHKPDNQQVVYSSCVLLTPVYATELVSDSSSLCSVVSM